MREDIHLYIKKGASKEVNSWLILVVGTVVLFAKFSWDADVVTFLVSMMTLGVISAVSAHQGRECRMRGEKCLKYAEIIADASEISLEDIAGAYPKSVEEVSGDLRALIDRGLLLDYSLNSNLNKIILSKEIEVQTKEAKGPAQASSSGLEVAKASANESNVVKCPNCGGINRLTGDNGDCEYCGSPLT